MQEQTNEIIFTPTIDLPSYLKDIIDFFVSYFPYVFSGIGNIIGYIIGLSIVVSVFLFIGIIYCVERLKYIRKKEDEIYSAKVDTGYEELGKENPEFLNKWTKVTKGIESENDSDWRQAILEADIMLGELLTKLGYKGEGIGEQLRRVNKGDFNTMDYAWEAHKIRNAIAHEGSNYPLSKHEARRIVSLYHQVFKEFFDF